MTSSGIFYDPSLFEILGLCSRGNLFSICPSRSTLHSLIPTPRGKIILTKQQFLKIAVLHRGNPGVRVKSATIWKAHCLLNDSDGSRHILREIAISIVPFSRVARETVRSTGPVVRKPDNRFIRPRFTRRQLADWHVSKG